MHSRIAFAFRTFCVAVVLSLVMSGPALAGRRGPDIVGLAQSAPELTSLVEAVIAADLAGTLAGEGPFTVFAPTNEAFLRLLDALEVNDLDEIDDRTLVNVLLDHIVTREVDEAELGRRARLVTIGRLRLTVDTRVGEVNGLPIVSGGIEAGNGTVYLIDGVLLDD